MNLENQLLVKNELVERLITPTTFGTNRNSVSILDSSGAKSGGTTSTSENYPQQFHNWNEHKAWCKGMVPCTSPNPVFF